MRVIAAPVSEAIDPDIEVEGTLAIAHADDFVRGRAEFIYELVEHNGRRAARHRVASAGPCAGGCGSRSQDARAPTRIDSSFAHHAARARPEERAGKLSDVPEKAVHNVLVILANFNNTAAPSLHAGAGAAGDDVRTRTASRTIHNEVSYGGQTLNVTVTNWVTMNISRPTSCNTSDWQAHRHRGGGGRSGGEQRVERRRTTASSSTCFPRCRPADGTGSPTSARPDARGSTAPTRSSRRSSRTRWGTTSACCTPAASTAAARRSAVAAR